MSTHISASLVLYNTPPAVFLPAITSFLRNDSYGTLVISDNSSHQTLHPSLQHPRVKYIFNNENLGFGAAHNRAIAAISGASDFHLILNPDIVIDFGVISHLSSVMQRDSGIGVLMPKIIYPDGSLQRLCKLLPSPLDLIFRRFIPIASLKKKVNQRYEMYGLSQDQMVDVPVLSGCFLMVRTKLFVDVGGFDERFFMYLEDVDLIRRVGDLGRVVYDPRVFVTHTYEKGSYHNMKLLGYHIVSAMRYFNKWGWFLDSTRRERNKLALMNLRNKNTSTTT